MARGLRSIPAILPPTFTITVTPAATAVEVKQPAAFSAQTTAVGGASTIALSCQAFQVSCGFTPAQVEAGQSAALAVTPPYAGNFPVTIVGDAGFAAESAAITVEVLDFYSAWQRSFIGNPLPTQVIEAGASATICHNHRREQRGRGPVRDHRHGRGLGGHGGSNGTDGGFQRSAE